ncbi:MAG: hypothetical protein ACRDD7_01405 [Peptostreptococcaceae bacterium]
MDIKIGDKVLMGYDGKDEEFGIDWEEELDITSQYVLDYVNRNMKYFKKLIK